MASETRDCVICYQKLMTANQVRLGCGHDTFCRPCFKGWCLREACDGEVRCPLCNQSVSTRPKAVDGTTDVQETEEPEEQKPRRDELEERDAALEGLAHADLVPDIRRLLEGTSAEARRLEGAQGRSRLGAAVWGNLADKSRWQALREMEGQLAEMLRSFELAEERFDPATVLGILYSFEDALSHNPQQAPLQLPPSPPRRYGAEDSGSLDDADY